jgi:hypothetical protein
MKGGVILSPQVTSQLAKLVCDFTIYVINSVSLLLLKQNLLFNCMCATLFLPLHQFNLMFQLLFSIWMGNIIPVSL